MSGEDDLTEQQRKDTFKILNGMDFGLLQETLRMLGIKSYTTEELCEEFDVISFLAPFVFVKRRSDGQTGSLYFKHSPRLYFDFEECDLKGKV